LRNRKKRSRYHLQKYLSFCEKNCEYRYRGPWAMSPPIIASTIHIQHRDLLLLLVRDILDISHKMLYVLPLGTGSFVLAVWCTCPKFRKRYFIHAPLFARSYNKSRRRKSAECIIKRTCRRRLHGFMTYIVYSLGQKAVQQLIGHHIRTQAVATSSALFGSFEPRSRYQMHMLQIKRGRGRCLH